MHERRTGDISGAVPQHTVPISAFYMDKYE